MKSQSKLALIGILGVAALIRSSIAGPAQTFRVEGYTSLDEGEAKEALIRSTGSVRAGQASRATPLPNIGNTWAAIRMGSTTYLGTDKDGSVYAVQNGSVKKLVALEGAVSVVSLAPGQGNTLYAGTMPTGQVWSINVASGKAKKLATLEDVETVWSLAVDSSGKKIYAGTGPDGFLWSVDTGSGKANKVFASDDKRILSIVVAQDGGVWFGTSEKALLYRYDPKLNRTRAISDFAGNEITALAEWHGKIYAAANDIKDPATTGVKSKAALSEAEGKTDKGQKPKMPDKGSKPGADASTPSGTGPTRTGERKGKGSLFRVLGDGTLTQVHALTQTYFTSLAVDNEGRVYAGAGDKGRIYIVDSDDAVATVLDVKERQINQLMWDDNRLWFVTMDATALYQTEATAPTASYTSKVFDAQGLAQFGYAMWLAKNSVGFETRSGNTEEPDESWSDWQPVGNTGNAQAGLKRGRIVSPKGRYVQFRALLRSRDAEFWGATLYYVAQNKPTKVSEITITPQNNNETRLLETTPDAKSPVLKLKWKTDNDDADETVYTLEFRRDGDPRWRGISTGPKPLTTTSFDWNTDAVPDGEYRLRVTANDSRANGRLRGLETSDTSRLFVVDNQKPRIENVALSGKKATARVTDNLSIIIAAAFSIDDGPWEFAEAQDQIFDDTSEQIELALPDVSAGAHTLVIRALDQSGNLGSQVTYFNR